MDRGLYIAATGMYAELARQDQLASDLANASTPGYKPTRAAQTSFGEVLISNTLTGQALGSIGLGAQLDAPRVDLAQGVLRETDEPLDVALEGPGFFRLQTADGIVYTRDGQFTTDANGRLVTPTGASVLDEQGRPITIPAGAKPAIGPDGAIRVNGQTVATLAVVSLANPRKIGDNAFSGTPGAKPAGTQVRQGYLEASAVDAATSMIDMIVSMRAYESSQRVIQAIDETLQRGIAAGSANGS